jgi:hypothetical protein
MYRRGRNLDNIHPDKVYPLQASQHFLRFKRGVDCGRVWNPMLRAKRPLRLLAAKATEEPKANAFSLPCAALLVSCSA